MFHRANNLVLELTYVGIRKHQIAFMRLHGQRTKYDHDLFLFVLPQFDSLLPTEEGGKHFLRWYRL